MVPISSILLGIVDASSACSLVTLVLLLAGALLYSYTECCSLLRATKRSYTIVVINSVDVVSRLKVILRLSYIPRFVEVGHRW